MQKTEHAFISSKQITKQTDNSISSNSYPSSTANKPIHCLKSKTKGRGIQKPMVRGMTENIEANNLLRI